MMTQRSILLGVVYTIGSYFFFTLNDAIVKWLVTDIPVVQVLCLRSVVTMGICLTVSGKVTLVKALYSPIRGRLLLRGILVLIAWLCYYSAAPYLALGEMVTLYFASPIFVAMLANRFLGERVTYWRWSAIIIGFVGVLAASRLDHLPHLLPSLLVLFAAGLWAANMILYRKDIAAETNSVQIFTMNTVLFVVCGLLLCWTAQAMTVKQWLLMAGIGAIGAIAQFMLLAGLKRIAASIAAPLEFSALIWSFLLGYLIWGDIPLLSVMIGALLITLSGVFIVVEAWWFHRKTTTKP
jgi:drug/metabolite transporter (DMT)-like permease